MTVRTVTKQLAAVEDLLLGTGTEQQLRNELLQTVTKIELYQPVATLATLKALDTAKYVYAAILDSTIRSFYFDSTSVAVADDTLVVLPDTGAGRWLRNTTARDTQANLTSQAASINTADKFAGKQVWDTTNDLPIWASGPLATDTWIDAAGVVAHTPV